MSASIYPFTDAPSAPRELHSLSELREMVGEACGTMEALCVLLTECSGSKIEAGLLLGLLRPVNKTIMTVACDMNDMAL